MKAVKTICNGSENARMIFTSQNLRFSILLLSTVMLCFRATAQINYRKVFGKDYEWAENWIKRNDKIFTVYSAKYNIPAKELKAIIFPELIRYNRVFDAIQIESLKYLYVTEGKQYADFSVGFFQMKPSFAERVELEADALFGYTNSKDNETSRRERLVRLTGTETQLNYLCAFYRLCEKKFPSCKSEAAADRIKFFATAYNAGYHLSLDKLRDLQSRKHFSGYNYSDISLYYFNYQLAP
jgi:hypothetical protein